MIVRVNGALLRFTDYRRTISVAAPTVAAGLSRLADEYQPLRKVLFDREGKVRSFVTGFNQAEISKLLGELMPK